MEELNSGQLLDLDEPSNGSIPYTPLFLAYINDHFQVGGWRIEGKSSLLGSPGNYPGCSDEFDNFQFSLLSKLLT